MFDRALVRMQQLPRAVLLFTTGLVALLSANSALAQTTVSPIAVNFGGVVVNQTSAITKVNLKNTQAVPLNISSLAVTAASPFALDPSTTCANPGALAPGATCTIGVTFAPTTLGAQPAGTLTITTDASNSPQTVALNGSGITAATLSPTNVGYGAVVVNTMSAAKTVTLRNNQTSPMTISGVLFGGPFALDTSAGSATTCPTGGGTLDAGKSCVIGITFNPVTTGPVAGGQITILDSAANSPQFTALGGTGVLASTVSPAALGFGYVVVNTTSTVKNLVLTNNQTVPLNISSIVVPAPFAVSPATTTCVVGTPVAPKTNCNIALTYAPTALGLAAPATVTINHDAPTSPQAVNVSGTGVAAVTISPTALGFSTVVLNQASVKTLTLTNRQTVPLTINSINGFTGGYSLDSSSTCPVAPLSIPSNGTCTIAVSLTATALGAQPGTFAINHNAAGSPLTVALSANAVAPVVLNPVNVGFPSQYQGTTSAPKTVKLTNMQSTALNISSIALGGTNSSDFAVTSTCPSAPASLPATQFCTLSVTFTPSGSGTRTASLTVTDDALGSPQTVNLTGSGSAPVVVSPLSITNYSANVGSLSAFKTITIKNANPAAALHFSNFLINGDFQQTATTCPTGATPLAGGASCTVSVIFAPTIGGTRSGQLQIYDDAQSSPQIVNLSGTGNNPLTLSPAGLTFPAQKLGTISPPKNITLTNHETQSESFTLTPAGNFTAVSNCSGGVIAANSSCVLTVNFAPSATATPGPLSGSLTVAHTAAVGSPLTVSLLGSASLTNPPAAVASVSPSAGAAGTTVNVTITGNTWTHFSPSSVITFTDTNSAAIPSAIAVTVPAPATTTANTINAQLVIDPAAIAGARNIKVVTPLSGGGNETAQLFQAFIIADPTNSHTISVVAPKFGIQGQTLNVSLTGTGTHFVNGTTFANFGDGVGVNSLNVTSATTAVANITISNTTPVGYRTITLVTGGEFAASNSQGFQIGPNNASFVSIGPNTAAQGASLPVTITAANTHFLQNATQLAIGGGVIVGNIQVTSATTATAQLAVSQSATIGVQNATVSTGGEIATLSSAFTITGATPALLSVAPSSGVQGQTLNVVIKGNTFTNFNQANILANFGGNITVNSTTVNNTHQVTANITISQNANVGGVQANLVSGPAGSTTIFPFGFTVAPSSAQIVSVTPSNVAQGAQVTLAVVGLNTHWVQGTTQSAFYPVPYENITVSKVTITDATHALLNVSVSTDTSVGTFGFYMATGGEVVSSTISVFAQTPTLTMSPANGLLPAPSTTNSFSVSFTGQFTHFGATTLPVIAGQGVTLSNFVVNSPVSATGTITILGATNGTPTATGPRLVTFTTGGEIVTTYFNVTATPVGIVNIVPYHAAQNTTLSVAIVGQNTHFTSGTTAVLFGPQITVNSITVTNPTHLTANITTSYLNTGTPTATPPGWNSVYVNTGTEQVITGFNVDAPATPSLASVSPNNGAQGSTVNVTITGKLTNWVQGTTKAIVGAGITVANLTITSPTTATATISVSPTAPVGGNSVIMITGSEIVGGVGFSVTPSAASIVTVGPTVPCTGGFVGNCGITNGSGTPWVVAQLQTSTLNLVGVGTHWLQGETAVSFGSGVVVNQLNVTSPTTATVQITVLSGSPVGYASLTTTTDGETVTLKQAIDIEQGFATLLATTPNAAQQGVTLTLQVLGRFTHWQQGVTSAAFNQDITVNSINVIDSSNLTANITVSPTAYVDFGSPCGHVITVTTGSEQVTGVPGIFCVQKGPAQINSVQPNAGVQGSTQTVTVTGSFTHFIQGVTTASFGAGINVGDITITSPTTATVPLAVTTAAPTGFATVTLTTYGEVATQQFAFSVSPGVATLNEAIPNQAQQGVQNVDIHLIGQYSHFSSLSKATFGTGIVVNSVTYTDPTDLVANITIDPLSYTGGRSVTVTTPGVPCSLLTNNHPCPPNSPPGTTGSEIVTNNVFSIIPGPAIISQVSPNTGNEGQEVIVNITGANTHWAQNFTQFYIAGGGSDITINSVVINSATSATADLTISPTANPGARSIYMVTAGESLSDNGAFVVTGGVPAITYLTPNNAKPGTSQLNVTIHGIYTDWTQATTTVSFGPGVTVTSYQVDNSTTIEAVINIAANAQNGYRTVVVQTGTQGLTSNFQVYTPPPPTPYISYYWPSSGLPGQTFTINFAGVNTEWDPTNTTATFGRGITVNTFQVISPTSARANITITATHAQTNLIVFTTPGTSYGTEQDSANFNVVVSVPTLSIVDPGSGLQGAQNLTVNVIGQFTTFDNTTSFNFGQGIMVNGAPTILGPTIATQSISIDQLATLGGRSVVATTQGVPVGGAGFSVTPSLALISAVTPNTALQGTTITVHVTGQNTHWSPATTFSFGSGIVVTSAVVNSATDATVTLALPALAPIGATSAQATTLGEIATISNGFVIQAGTPLILSSGPGSAPQQGSVIFTILGQATHWLATPPTVDLGPGVTLTNVVVTGDSTLTVSGFIQPTTNIGYRNLTVSTGTQVLSLPNALYVTPGPAVVNSVSPATGGQGVTLATVNINGINTHWQQGVTQLTFPNVLINSYTVNSATNITANITVNLNAAPGQVTVTTTTLGEVATKVNAFTITQTQPQLVAAVPSTGTQGQTENVTLTGVFTHFVNGTSTASFGTGITVNSVTVNSATSAVANITVQPTTTLGYRNVSVTTGAEVVSLTNGFQVTQGPAAIQSLTPATGNQNNSYAIAVVGSQTHFLNGITTAAFGGGISVTGVTVTDALHATVNITIPSSTTLGAYNVTLTTGGETATILGGFTVSGGTANISTVSPPTGTQGTTINVTLTGQFTHFVNGTSTASFGTGITVNSLAVSSATSAVANITISPTATLSSRNVSVTTGAETASITGGFTVLAGVPALLTTSPTFAQAGTTANVVVNGQFTSFVQGVSTVSFGSGITVNLVTVSSATQLTANISVAANATVGNRDITVTTNSQNVTLNNAFSVTAGTPVVIQITPNIGAPGNTVSVTIKGQYTNWGATTKVSFGPQIAVGGAALGASGPVAVGNTTTLTASAAIQAGATVGPQDVVVTTGAEVEHVVGGFTIQPPVVTPPTVISLSPGANAGGMPINSDITAVFSQPMDRTTLTTSSVLLYLTSNPSSGYLPVTGTVTVDATGRVVTFSPSALLAVNATYYFQLTNTIKDAAGNAFSNYATTLYSTFSANTTPPVVIAVNPPASTTGVGTNAVVQVQFSADMNQSTQAGLILKAGASAVAGSYSWNSQPTCCWGPGTILTFTPTAPLTANTVYTVAYSSALTDTAGNALTPGSFTFTTGAGTDTATSNASFDFVSGQTNVGTNIVPRVLFTKPMNPIDINPSSLLLYNADTGKYILGAVTLAADAKSATFAPNAPLLPNTYYYLHMGSGNFDLDGNYLNGANGYFTTGAGASVVPPQVASIFPANTATSVPINAQIVVHFNEPIDPLTANAIHLKKTSGGTVVPGTNTLGADQMTLTFVPTAILAGNTQFTVTVNGYKDLSQLAGSTLTTTFTTSNSVAPVILSTGFNASNNLITVNNTNDAHWVVKPNGSSTTQPLQVVGPGDTGWYSGWPANGPASDWVTLNPNSTTGNTLGTYSTTFDLTGYTLTNLCLVGSVGIDDNGTLLLNGTAITSQISATSSLFPLAIPLPSASLVAGLNTLSLQWGSTDNSYEAFRLQARIESCGASFTGNLSLVSSTPANAAAAVATNTTITLNFNHPLDPATVSSSTLPVMIGWNSNQIISGNYVVSGSQVVFTPSSPFPINTTIYVGNCNGPYDTAGDTYPGCYGLQWLQFTTGGTVTPPGSAFQVSAFTPAFGAANVGLRSPVTATFNRSFNPGTINTPAINFALFNGDSQSPWCTSFSRSQDNDTLQFNCYPLPASSVMTAFINNSIKDWSGNALTNFSSEFSTTYYDSNTNGTIIDARPGTGSNNIAADAPLVLFSNLPINASSAAAGLQVAQNNVPISGTVQVLDSGYSLVFTPTTPFTPGALVQWWTTSSLTDTTYGTIINPNSGYYYIAKDTSTLVPAVQVSSPSAYSNPVATNTFFDLQFNTPLDAATVTSTNIYLYNSANGLHVPAAYTMPKPNQVRMVPSSPLSPGVYYYVYITAGLHSSTSVPAAATNWYVYTGAGADNTLPAVTSAVPFNGSTNVGVNVQPGVIFNKGIDPVSVNSTTFQVTNSGTPLAGSYWFNSSNTRVEFVPNAPLPASTNLVMKLTGVLDPVGNPVNFTSNFQTAPGSDYNAPYVVSTSVAANEVVPTNTSITTQFSESMDVTTFNSNNIRIYDALLGTNIAATLSWSADQSTAYLVPSAPLAAGRQYYFSANGGTDLAGNTVQGVSFYFYADFTVAAAAPTATLFNPINGATGIGVNAIIQTQFDAPLDPNTLSAVKLSTGGSTIASAASLTAGNTVIQITPQKPLKPNTTYLVTFAGVKDPAGNAVATVTNSFTTGATFDIVAPSVVTYSPAYNSTVGTNAIIKMVFSKPVNPISVTAGTMRLFLYDTGQLIPVSLSLSANAMQLTMQPVSPLQPNTRYHFQACCGYLDQNGNYGNQLDSYFYTGSGTSVIAPTVSVSPVNGATAIPLNAQVVATSSAQIDPTSWNQNSLQVTDNLNHPVAGTVVLTSNTTLTFTPTAALSASITYKVKVSGFKDANGNTVTTLNTTFTTGTAASPAGLTLLSTNIPFGATGVSNTQPIILTFSQILNPATVNSNTLLVMNGWNSNNGLAGTYAVSGAQVTFTPTSPYPAGAQIYMGECGGPSDVLGDVFLNGGCYGQQLISFTVNAGTVDTSALHVLSVNPASNATGVRPDSSVSVTFNKSINPYSVYNNTNNALLFAGQTVAVRGSITMSADNRTLTFNSGTLASGTVYTISFPAGGITDPSGNTLATAFNSTFTTTSNPAGGNGSVQGTSPAANATGVPVSSLLTLYLNRPVDPSSIAGNLTVVVNGQVYAGTTQSVAGGYELQFTPSVPFPADGVVQWFFSNVYDIYGDVFNSNSGTFYMVPSVNAATAAPQVVAVSPSYGGTNVPTNAQVDIVYSQPISAATLAGNVAFVNGSVPVAISQPAPNIVRLIPNSALAPSTTYYVCSNTSVKGTNNVPAVNSCYATYFTTAAAADSTPGTVTVGPPDGSVNVGTNGYIRFTFSKPADRTTINSTNVQITSGGAIPGTWSFVTTNGDITGANFTPVNPLPPSSVIQISTNGLLDYAGNAFTALNTQFTTAATPNYNTPTVTQDFPYGTTGIDTNASFTCRYSEAMDPSSITQANTYLYSYATNAHVPVTFHFSADLLSMTMTPNAALAASTQYYYYCGGGIDLTGNGQSNAIDLFTTGTGPSSVGPTLVQANPANGATNVPLNLIGGPWSNTSLGLLFSEPLAPNSLGSITLTPNGGSALPITLSQNIGNTELTVQLPYLLQPNTTYTYSVSGAKDYTGNSVTAATSTFTTGSTFDWVSPSVTSVVPASGATAVNATTPGITVNFNEAMNTILIDGAHIYLRNHNTSAVIATTITFTANHASVKLTPAAPLSAATIYDVVYAAPNWYITDVAGNPDYSTGVLTTFTTQ